MTDFDTAVARGMAQRIPLTAAESQLVRELLVIGMPDPHLAGGPVVTTHATAPPTTTDRLELEALIDAHRYTDGIAFVRQGTPTNNSGGRRALGLEPGGPRLRAQLPVERAIAPDLDDGAAVAYALGISGAKLERVERADASEQSDARNGRGALAVYRRLLPARDAGTGGHARGRGGGAPLVPRPGPAAGPSAGTACGCAAVRHPARLLRSRTGAKSDRPGCGRTSRTFSIGRSRAGSRAPSRDHSWASRGGDETEHLAGLLRMDAASQQAFAGRHALGSDFLDYFGAFVRVDGVEEELAAEYSWVTHSREVRDLRGRARRLHFAPSKDGQVKMPTVQDEPLSEDDGLAGATNYISWLAAAPVLDVRDMTAYPGGAPPKSLLFNVLRQSVLLENAARAFEALAGPGRSTTT